MQNKKSKCNFALLNTSRNLRCLLGKNILLMSLFTESQFSCHFCILQEQQTVCSISMLFQTFKLSLYQMLQRRRLQSSMKFFSMRMGLFPLAFLQLTQRFPHFHDVHTKFPSATGISFHRSFLHGKG